MVVAAGRWASLILPLAIVVAILAAGSAALLLPFDALHQDAGQVTVPDAVELSIPLLVDAPLVVGSHFTIEAFSSDRDQEVVLRLLLNERLMAESVGSLQASLTVQEPRESSESLVLIILNQESEPVALQYYADVRRPAFTEERFLLGVIVFVAMGAPLVYHQLATRLRPGVEKGSPTGLLPLLLTGWVLILYSEAFGGVAILESPALLALRTLLLSFVFYTFRSPFGLVPVASALTGIMMASRSGHMRIITLGILSLALLLVLFFLTLGLGR
jgi:hypothetical protein